MKKLTNHTGFTLLELLIAAYILTIGISSTLLLNVNAMTSSQYAWDLTVATSHAEHIFEEMQVKENLADITATDWTAWAAKQQILTLPGEKIDVQYEDPTGDPLNIKLSLAWQRNLRKSDITLITGLTK
jgi:prepilin-type N-terminal cleavage/methylation domain-containing protein